MRPRFGKLATSGTTLLLLAGCAAGTGVPTQQTPTASTITVSPPAEPNAASGAAETVLHSVYTTAYTWFDNTPPGSTIISNPVLHARAGGTGTYADPVTAAVGHSKAAGKDVLDFPAGTRLYIPDVRRYFIVEDTCGNGPRPQDEPCHRGTNADGTGSTVWVDLWIGGQDGTRASVRRCASRVTSAGGALHTVIVHPAPGYLVAPGGGVFHNGKCDAGYGNTIRKSANR